MILSVTKPIFHKQSGLAAGQYYPYTIADLTGGGTIYSGSAYCLDGSVNIQIDPILRDHFKKFELDYNNSTQSYQLEESNPHLFKQFRVTLNGSNTLYSVTSAWVPEGYAMKEDLIDLFTSTIKSQVLSLAYTDIKSVLPPAAPNFSYPCVVAATGAGSYNFIITTANGTDTYVTKQSPNITYWGKALSVRLGGSTQQVAVVDSCLHDFYVVFQLPSKGWFCYPFSGKVTPQDKGTRTTVTRPNNETHILHNSISHELKLNTTVNEKELDVLNCMVYNDVVMVYDSKADKMEAYTVGSTDTFAQVRPFNKPYTFSVTLTKLTKNLIY